VLRRWRKAASSTLGRWLFALAVCRQAPYFRSIAPEFLELAPGLCRVRMPRRRAVENHVGTIHAIAIGNLCELAAGMATEVSLPPTLRWIPRGMTIEYLKPAETALVATSRLDRNEWAGAQNVGIPVTVVDRKGVEVVRAVITMYVSPRGETQPRTQ
jgi:acyl-coenzyme A thioesterase PaaI-like protein